MSVADRTDNGTDFNPALTAKVFSATKIRNMKASLGLIASLLACFCLPLSAADTSFDGLNLDLGNLYRVSSAQSRSISPENFTGEKGLAAGTAADATASAAAASDDSAKAAQNSDASGDDDPLKKKDKGKGITLARKVSRVTVLLPGKN